MKLTLHDYRRCPFCIRTRIVLHLKNINHEIVNEPLREWTDWMLANVDKPRVPVLHIEKISGEEIVMPESNEINLWLDSNFGGVEFTPEDKEIYREMEDWWDWCGNVFKQQIDLYKYGKDRVFQDDAHAYHTEDLKGMLQKIENKLEDRTYLLGETLTLADIAIIPFIRQIMRTRNGEFNFTPYQNILRWSALILDQEWFDDIVMAKRDT